MNCTVSSQLFYNSIRLALSMIHSKTTFFLETSDIFFSNLPISKSNFWVRWLVLPVTAAAMDTQATCADPAKNPPQINPHYLRHCKSYRCLKYMVLVEPNSTFPPFPVPRQSLSIGCLGDSFFSVLLIYRRHLLGRLRRALREGETADNLMDRYLY